MLDRTDGRETLGSVLASSGIVRAMIADSVLSIGNRRGLMLRCAWELGQGRDGLHESSVGKGFVGGAVRRIADRAAQICGSPGVSGDLPAPRMVEAGRVRTYDRPTEGHKWAIAWRARRDRRATT